MEEGVAILSINCELQCANRRDAQWRAVVARVRRAYSGWLTESAMPLGCAGSAQYPNGTTIGGPGQCAGVMAGSLLGACTDGVGWWDTLDLIGVDAYFVLNGTTSTVLAQQWRRYVAWARELSHHHKKPVVFTEVGYCSGGCNRQGAASAADYALQALHYQGLFDAFAGEEAWFLGAFWWNWNSDDGFNHGDTFLSPQWKPAEDVLRRYYRATVPKPQPRHGASECMGAGLGTC